MRKSLALSLFVLACGPLWASERPARAGDDGVNLQFTLTLAETGASTRSVSALLLEDQRTRLSSGWRVPTATVLEDAPGGDCRSGSLHYQDVGLGATLHGRVVGPGRIRASGEIELSSVASSESHRALGPGAPVVATFRHVFDVVLEEGAGTTLAEVPSLEGGSMTLSISAEIDR